VRLEAYANSRANQHESYSYNRRSDERSDERVNKRISQVENDLRKLNTESRSGQRRDDAQEWRRKYEEMAKDYERLKCLEDLRAAKQRESKDNVASAPKTYEPPRCYGCGRSGHYARSCPDKRNPAPEANSRNAAGNQQREAQSNAAHNVAGISSDECCEAYLRLRINGEPVDCLLDTGSEATLVPFRIAKDAYIEHTDHTLRAANGTVIPVIGRTTIVGAIGRLPLTIDCFVTRHVGCVILGLSWLKQHKAMWDFEHGSISINGRQYGLRSRQPSNNCRRIIVDGAAVIPPRSECELSTIVEFDRLTQHHASPTAVWITDVTEPVKGLLVARSIVPSRPDNIPVRVMNVTHQPVELPPGTVVTTLQPAEPIVEGDSAQPSSITEQAKVLQSLIDAVDDEVPDDVRERLLQMLLKYSTAFSFHENDLGRTSVIRHGIDTGTARPSRQALRRQPPSHQAANDEHIDSMLAQRVIEPAQSPWASNIVIVRKKDGTTRCCVDYRQVNLLTRKDAYPLPRTDDCLDALAGARWFTTLDLRSSYHQIELEPSDADKTAFICRRGSFRYLTMPFGLCNAGATFQRLMDVLMMGLKYETCVVYLDDIVVFSSSLNQHVERLELVLQRLQNAGLKLKPEKCKLMRRAVDFLGHIVSADGVSVNPDKISAVVDWPIPANITELRAFLGLCSYYRKFVQGFSEVAAPLYNLTSKKNQFIWDNDCQVAFDTLKTKLTSAPILCMPNEQGTFILDTDASNFAIGAVLSQVVDGTEHVVAYASRRLTRSEMNYCVTRRELLAVVFFTKYFRNYLLGRNFSIRTDHAALQWLRRMPDPCGQQARWIGALEEFDYSILHRPGSRHSNADAMSRRPCDRKRCCGKTEAASEVIDECTPDELHCAAVDHDSDDDQADVIALDTIRQAQTYDTDIAPILNMLSGDCDQPAWDDVAHMSACSKSLWRQWGRLRIINGVLCRRFERINESPIWQTVMPRGLRHEFVKTAHEGMNGGHLGRKRTEAIVKARAYWPGWLADVRSILRRCSQCARYHRGSAPKNVTLKPFCAGEPWETVSIDITGPHPRSRRGYVFMLTVMDHFSKWAEAIPIRNHTAETVARVLYEHVFSRFGAPKRILSDQGAEFEGILFTELCRLLRINKARCTLYKPSTNGMLERFHRTLNSMLAKIIDDTQRDWCEVVPLVMAAYRATPHDTTGYSPNKVIFGRENRMPLDLMFPPPPGDPVEQLPDDYVRALEERLRAAYEAVRQNTGAAAARRKDSYDVGIGKKVDLQQGDYVWYFYPRRRVGLSPKWQSWYTGPYRIISLIDSHCVKIQKTRRSKPLIVHRDKLKLYYGDTPAGWSSPEPAQQDPAGTVDSAAPNVVAYRRPRRRQSRLSTEEPIVLGRRQVARPRRFDDYV
jgi:transposase InsO family protein